MVKEYSKDMQKKGCYPYKKEAKKKPKVPLSAIMHEQSKITNYLYLINNIY